MSEKKKQKKPLIVHNEAELMAYLDFCIEGHGFFSPPSIKFSEAFLKASEFKIPKKKAVSVNR